MRTGLVVLCVLIACLPEMGNTKSDGITWLGGRKLNQSRNFRSCDCSGQNLKEKWELERCDEYACMTCNMMGSELNFTFSAVGKMFDAAPEKKKSVLVKNLCKTIFNFKTAPELNNQCFVFMSEFMLRHKEYSKLFSLANKWKMEQYEKLVEETLKEEREMQRNPNLVLQEGYVHNRANKKDVSAAYAIAAWAAFETCSAIKCCNREQHIFPNDISFQFKWTSPGKMLPDGNTDNHEEL